MGRQATFSYLFQSWYLHENISSEKGYFDIVSSLIEHNADTTAKDKFNRTALHYASKKDIKNYLKQHGAPESKITLFPF